MNIPIEVLQYIDSFICDKYKTYSNLSMISNKFNKSNCNISKYKNLLSCGCHDNIYQINAVCKLIYAKTYKESNINNVDKEFSLDKDAKSYFTIHFISKKSLKIAEPYLKDFGVVSHYCCSNTGVMYYC